MQDMNLHMLYHHDALVIHTVTVSDDVIKYDRYGQNLFTDTTSSDIVIADYTFQP